VFVGGSCGVRGVHRHKVTCPPWRSLDPAVQSMCGPVRHVAVKDMDGDGAFAAASFSAIYILKWHQCSRCSVIIRLLYMISTGDKDLVVSHPHGVDYYPRSGTTFSTVMPVVGERFMYSVGAHPADFDGDEVEDVVTHSTTQNFTCFVQDNSDPYDVSDPCFLSTGANRWVAIASSSRRPTAPTILVPPFVICSTGNTPVLMTDSTVLGPTPIGHLHWRDREPGHGTDRHPHQHQPG
jgi:hypothetical protein